MHSLAIRLVESNCWDVTITKDRQITMRMRGEEKFPRCAAFSFFQFRERKRMYFDNMADIQEQQRQEDAIASSDEKGTARECAAKTGMGRNDSDEEAGPSNMVTRARQRLSDLFTIVTLPYTSENEDNANLGNSLRLALP